MTDLDKMARELLAAEWERDGIIFVPDCIRHEEMLTKMEQREIRAITAALLTAPPGYRLVPIVPTDAMRQAAHRAPLSGHPETGGQSYKAIYQAMIAAAPEPEA